MDVNVSFCKLAQNEYTDFEHLVLLETLLGKREANFKVLRAIKLKAFSEYLFYLLMKLASLFCSFLFWPLTFH